MIGTGSIASHHATACLLTDRTDLVAVYDVSAEALDRFTQQFDVSRQYTSLDDMLAQEEIDIAVICTWGIYHAELGIQLAESKRVKAILCEKPFAQNAAEAEALVSAGRENDVLVAEAFKFRHHPMHLRAHEIIQQGGIGALSNVRGTFCANIALERRQPHLNWRFNRSQGGGSIYDLACYNIHHARFVFGEEPERVFAAQMPGVEVDDAAFILLAFSGGRAAQISVSFGAWGSQYVEMAGDGGLLRIEKAWNNENQAVALEHHTQEGVEQFEFEPTFQFGLQLEHLCACLDTGAPHRIAPEYSIAQMKVLDAVSESMHSGKTVELKERL